ncbi:MAG: 4-hydroxy-tetrahydrodipicolinate synthase [Polyangiaceae bacterium]|nr:4-hydroxy-tetrahydrodipicolinate synthase [Polyangiaceae bacterium]
MTLRPLSGVFTALVTPFLEDTDKIDWGGFEKLLEVQLSAKVAGVVPCGTTGETPTLTEDEQQEIIRFTAKHAKGRTFILAGTGNNSTHDSIHLSKRAVDAGADAVMIVMPYYNRPSQAGLLRHVELIGKAISVPIVLYNIPHRSAVALEPDTTRRMLEVCPHIIAIKDATGALNYSQDIIPSLNPGVSLLSGDDPLTLPLMSVGARGVISVASNLYPKQVMAVVEDMAAGQFEAALVKHRKLMPVYRALFSEPNPQPIKAALAQKGLMGPYVRSPLVEVSPECQKRLAAALSEFEAT